MSDNDRPSQTSQQATGNQNVQVSGEGNVVNVIYAATGDAAPPAEGELLPSLQPPVPLPDLFPIANNLIGHADTRDQLNAWYDALAEDRRGRYACILGRPG